MTKKQENDFKKVVLFLLDDWSETAGYSKLPDRLIKIDGNIITDSIQDNADAYQYLKTFLNWTIDPTIKLNSFFADWGCNLIDPKGKIYRVEQHSGSLIFTDYETYRKEKIIKRYEDYVKTRDLLNLDEDDVKTYIEGDKMGLL